MNRKFLHVIGSVIASVVLLCTAQAQFTGPVEGPYDPNCWPPMSTTGPSTGYIFYYGSNLLFGVGLGLVGTDTYGTTCIASGATMNLPGRFGWSIGSLGSVQSTIDDNMTLTWGMPFSAGDSCGFAMIDTGQDGSSTFAETLFGTATVGGYVGGSDRYCILESVTNNVNVNLRVDLLGDASRFDWKLYNLNTTSTFIGMKTCAWPQFAVNFPGDSPITYIYSPGFKPFQLEQVFQRVDPVYGMPNTMIFALSQPNAYGLQIINSPLTAPNSDGINVPDQTPVDDLVLAGADDALNGPDVSPFTATPKPPSYPNYLYFGTDTPFDPDFAGFQQVWHTTQTAPGSFREIVSYYRSTWGVSDYDKPFAAVVDAPKTISTVTSNPTQFVNQNFTLRVYVDNVRGYATVGQTLNLTNVRVEVDLPQGMVNANNPTGSSSQSIVSYIPSIPPATVGYVDFPVTVLSSVQPGNQSYTVTIDTNTGAHKVLTGSINVAATPNLNILEDANLVSVPWNFTTQNWSQILADPSKGTVPAVDVNFQAFTWDAINQQYIVQPNATRGVGTFIVSTLDQGTVQLQGNPTEDPNTTTTDLTKPSSAISVTLYPGWNLIGDPFNYAFPLGQLVGADTGNGGASGTATYAQLVSEGLLSGGFAYYDPISQSYQYISNTTDLVEPNQGYWVYVSSPSPLLLNFPVILSPFVQASQKRPVFQQSATQWRLQLSARNSKRIDSQNYVGIASASVAKAQQIVKPPVAPISNAISVSIKDTINGKSVNLAQSLRSTGSAQSWNVQVYSKAAGPVTLTWPNLNTLPTGIQFKLTDNLTGVTRNLRTVSGYTFTGTQGGTYSFTISSVNGAAARAVIGSVSVAQASRAVGSPFTINYTLLGDATTTVSVLQNGRVIYQPVASRSDHAGLSTAVWNLRDVANRAVAPGQYQVEIVAEDATGSRFRRVVPITVTR